MNFELSPDQALRRNGNIAERARLAGRSLTREERDIIAAGRLLARFGKITRLFQNGLEMEGERERNVVFAPLHVEAVFAFYWEAENSPTGKPYASYIIRKSNHPAFPVHGNLGAEDFIRYGLKIPKTPTYEQWVKNGKKMARS